MTAFRKLLPHIVEQCACRYCRHDDASNDASLVPFVFDQLKIGVADDANKAFVDLDMKSRAKETINRLWFRYAKPFVLLSHYASPLAEV